MSKNDVLLLTAADEQNYHALCHAVHGISLHKPNDRNRKDRLSITAKFALLSKQDYCCAHCGKEFEDSFHTMNLKKKSHRVLPEDVTTEHVIPYRYGSAANSHNVILVHAHCNRDRDTNFSIELIEDHYGKIDMTMIKFILVVEF